MCCTDEWLFVECETSEDCSDNVLGLTSCGFTYTNGDTEDDSGVCIDPETCGEITTIGDDEIEIVCNA